MKAVVQRVKYAMLDCDGRRVSDIKIGLCVYFGVAKGDDFFKAEYLAKKISTLRIFEDVNGKMNLSVKDIDGEILVISQFTLLANVSHGNRPSFSFAEDSQKANEMYDFFVEKLEYNGVSVKTGVFGGDMKITQCNDGPVTIIYDV